MKPLETIDAETLLSTPLKPVHFIVDRLIPTGLHMLSGSPKIGKSWLMLWLCLCVANGDPLWDFPTNRCVVLYLCLEDTHNRIQQRLFEIAETAPDTLRFATFSAQINTGLEQQIVAHIAQYPDTRLIVIDTLQRVRGVAVDNNAYANDYRETTLLKQLADKYGLAIILVHHLRKMASDDPFQRVSGTTGLTGAVDTNLVMEKDKASRDTVKLYATGRDVEYMELTLRFENCVWQLVSCETAAEAVKRAIPPFLFQVVHFMSGRGSWRGPATQLLREIGSEDVPVNAVTKLLNQYHASVLADNSITYDFHRSGKVRTISLAKSDGSDGCDGEIPIGKKPS